MSTKDRLTHYKLGYGKRGETIPLILQRRICVAGSITERIEEK